VQWESLKLAFSPTPDIYHLKSAIMRKQHLGTHAIFFNDVAMLGVARRGTANFYRHALTAITSHMEALREKKTRGQKEQD